MFLTRSEYDRGINTFSPEGRLFQVEYAMEAIELGSTTIGIKTNEGVVLLAERRLSSSLIIPNSNDKVFKLADHIGTAASGLVADSRVLVDHMRNYAAYHTFSYDEDAPVESVVQSACDLALSFGEKNAPVIMSRPFGVAFLIAGQDQNNYKLYLTGPSGSYIECKVKAIGTGSETAQSQLEMQYKEDMNLDDGILLGLFTLKQAMEEKLTHNNISMAILDSNGFNIVTPEFIAEYLPKIPNIIKNN